MVLAVQCNAATEHLFIELGDSVPCITPEKADALNTRMQREMVAKNKRLEKLYDKLLNGEITQDQFDKLYAVLGKLTLTEDFRVVPPSERTDLTRAMKSSDAPIRVGLTDADWDKIEQKIIRETPPASKRSELERQTLRKSSSEQR